MYSQQKGVDVYGRMCKKEVEWVKDYVKTSNSQEIWVLAERYKKSDGAGRAHTSLQAVPEQLPPNIDICHQLPLQPFLASV
ncbi:hypothetical protein C0Q70_16941 [Pomacea canaliculata]|uniref:Uncharacterized protein n=1 Tax=Pomacea canaliculata TaxID=400727 RepID=A0A2T7NR85_POMCA|nr:hypothetical protein C0Q70_16941 [Pomacea canaliculata]